MQNLAAAHHIAWECVGCLKNSHTPRNRSLSTGVTVMNLVTLDQTVLGMYGIPKFRRAYTLGGGGRD